MLQIEGSILAEEQPFRDIAEHPGMYVFEHDGFDTRPVAPRPQEQPEKLLFIGGAGITLGADRGAEDSEVPGMDTALSSIFGKDNERVTGDALERLKLALMAEFIADVEPVQEEENPLLHSLARGVYSKIAHRRRNIQEPTAPSGIVLIGSPETVQADLIFSRDLVQTTKSLVGDMYSLVRQGDWGLYHERKQYVPLAEYVYQGVRAEGAGSRTIPAPSELIDAYTKSIMPAINAHFMPRHEQLSEALHID